MLAALLPYGRSRNYGLLATFLTPLVVVLIDLLSPGGWRLAEDRLIDTLIGCAIVLLIGFAPWPMSWYAHLPRQFAQTALDVRRYLEEALGGRLRRAVGPGGDAPPARSRLRRSTYRALADLRAEFQRTMSEPPSISRRATAWWPAVVGLEQVMDAVTATAVAVSRGAGGVRRPGSAAVRGAAGGQRGGVRRERRWRRRRSCRTTRRSGRSPRRSGRCSACSALVSGSPRASSGLVAAAGLVGLAGFEPATSATQTRRASQAALQPVRGRV